MVPYKFYGASLVAQMVKNLPAMQETWVQSLSWEDPVEKEMVSHFSYTCLENSMGRGTWWAIIHGVTKSWTQLSGGLFLLVLQKISWIGDRDYIKSVACIE